MAPAAAWIVTLLQTPVYRASAVLRIDPNDPLKSVGALLDTEVKRAGSPDVARRAAALLGWVAPAMPEETVRNLANAIQSQSVVERVGESNRLRISVLDAKAERAAALANALMYAYIQQAIDKNNSVGIFAQSSFVDHPALAPKRPLRPDLFFNLSLGAGGLFLGLVSAFLTGEPDAPPVTAEDKEQFFGLPVLSVIPRLSIASVRSFSLFRRGPGIEESRRRTILFHPSPSSFADSYEPLRANLSITARPGGRPAPAVAFTSAASGEGKTLTAVNVALAAAQSGLRVLFIDADFRRPFAHKLLGMPREPGLVDAVLGNKNWLVFVRGMPDFLFGELKVAPWLQSSGIENFHLLASGRPPLKPEDVLREPSFDRLLKEARSRFDLVVIDGAPVGPFADALIVGQKADGVVLVRRSGVTDRDELKRAAQQLLDAKSRVLGVVING